MRARWVSDGESAATLVAASALVGVFAWFTVGHGGFDPLVWLPGALLLLGAVLALAFGAPALLAGVPRSSLVALACLAAFAAWSYLSIAWAGAKGDAWDGANRTLLYLVAFALAAIVPWTARAAAVALGAFAGVVAVAGVASVAAAARADDPSLSFTGALFIEPVGYHNGAAALFLIAFWPALVLSSRRELPPLARGLALASAGVLLSLAVIPQSRGSLVVSPFVAALAFAIVPGRVRLLLSAVAVGAATLVALDALLSVYREAQADRPSVGRARARDALLFEAAALAALGVVLCWADRRLTIPPRVVRVGSGAVAAVAIAALGIGIAKVVPPDPVEWAGDRWAEFKSGYRPDSAATHFTSHLGNNRYDFWRVGLLELRDAPVRGIGADNFAVPYLERRRSDEEPRYPHSWQVQILSQAGLVGAALFGAFLAAALAAAARGRRERTPFARALAAGGVVSAGYWLAHGTGDWLWELPGLAAPALTFLALAGRAGRMPRSGGGIPRAAAGVAAVAAAAAAAALALPWLAAREQSAARDVWQRDAPAAYAHLERARRLNPLSERPDLLAGAIASRREDWPRMRQSFLRALERKPESWYAQFELALVDLVERRPGDALARLDRAEALNPQEPAIALVRERIETGTSVSPGELDRFFLERARARTR